MEFRYLIDTNILIYFIKNQIPQHEFLKVADIIKVSFNVSIMIKIELLSWNKLPIEDLNHLETFIASAHVIGLTDDIANYAIRIRKSNNIKTADSVIAATAIISDMILATRNEKDFTKVESLKIYNPFVVSV